MMHWDPSTQKGERPKYVRNQYIDYKNIFEDVDDFTAFVDEVRR